MTESPRLLLINYEFPPLGGGAGTATLNLARELARLGADVTVLTSAFRGLPKREDRDGYKVVRIPTWRRRRDRCSVIEMMIFTLSASFFCWPVLSRLRPQAVIAFFSIPCGPIALLIKLLTGIPYVVSLRGGDVPGMIGVPAVYHILTRPLTRLIWRQARHVVANSRGLQTLARATAPELTIQVIANGVDLSAFPAVMRQERSPIALLFVGRLHHQKGLDVLLPAIAALPSMLKEAVRLEIVGDGPEAENLRKLAVSLNLTNQIHFHGWIDRSQIQLCYTGADIFVLPSRDEGMPNVLLEAMASALPVIATRVSGSDELVLPGETGLLVDVDDVLSLKDAIAVLARDAHLRIDMGRSGRVRVESRFSWPAAAQSYFDLVRI